jgi:hypothetical protein
LYHGALGAEQGHFVAFSSFGGHFPVAVRLYLFTPERHGQTLTADEATTKPQVAQETSFSSLGLLTDFPRKSPGGNDTL